METLTMAKNKAHQYLSLMEWLCLLYTGSSITKKQAKQCGLSS